ncbi:hypothetical protein DMB95_00175 [Campylobacter sp. MIT 12-8780]|uniref:hypothetical protein n=1 Tax=Campylobacter sp. MIT 12-8780 TaxID=2202200 RepID=UPI00115D44BD|nr:hypothetical protein [Campylobacter sp. MIT 12-8780]TQR42952.1 hypothetical protein DMB95_00175 [Campylobacter sp. MIT 12-8780]
MMLIGSSAPASAVVARLSLPGLRQQNQTTRSVSVQFTNPYPDAKVLKAVVSGTFRHEVSYSFLNINRGVGDRNSNIYSKNINETHTINTFIGGGGGQTFTAVLYTHNGHRWNSTFCELNLNLTFYYEQ